MADSTQWLAALRASDPEIRLDAVGRLDGLSEEERLAPLVAVLGDPEWRVRKAASGRLKRFAVTPSLLEALLSAVVQDGAPWLRTAAMEVMISHAARSDAGRVVTFLLNGLERVEQEPRKFIVELLGQMGDPRGVDALIGQLRIDDENLQLSVLDALARIGDPRVVPAVVERLERGSDQVRFAALSALQLLVDPDAVPAVVRALDQRPLRQLAMETLGLIGDARAMAPLWRWWSSGSGPERDGALLAMEKIMDRLPERERDELTATIRCQHGPAQTAELLARLDAPEPRLQQAAIAMAGWLREPSLVMPVVHLLGGDLAPHAGRALAALAADHLDSLLELLPRATPTICRALIELLSTTADGRVAPALRTALASPDHQVRRAAALGLAACRDHEAAPLLVGLLSDPDPQVQEAAVAALGACRDPRVVPSVITLLANESPMVRRNGARALGRLKATEAGPQLALALNDPDGGVRAAAIMSLSAIGSAIGKVTGDGAGAAGGTDALTAHLLLALGDEAPEVRLTAARALEPRVSSVPVEWWACLLEDADQWVRAMAARFAERSDELQAGLVLQQCLRDDSGAVQIAALEVFGRRPELGCVEAIRALLESPDADVAIAALEALAAVSPAEARRQAAMLAGREAHVRLHKAATRMIGEVA